MFLGEVWSSSGEEPQEKSSAPLLFIYRSVPLKYFLYCADRPLFGGVLFLWCVLWCVLCFVVCCDFVVICCDFSRVFLCFFLVWFFAIFSVTPIWFFFCVTRDFLGCVFVFVCFFALLFLMHGSTEIGGFQDFFMVPFFSCGAVRCGAALQNRTARYVWFFLYHTTP